MMKAPLSVVVALLLSLIAFQSPSAGQTIEITVAESDTLSAICKKYLHDARTWPSIAQLNKLANPDLIFPGQKLIIPVEYLKGVPLDAVVTFMKGNVQIASGPEGNWSGLKINASVPENSRIRTGSDGFVEITFNDGSSLFLKQSTELGISEASERGGLYYLNKLFLRAGRIITTIKRATGKESRFEVETPSAVAVARGTGFRSGHDDQDTSRFQVLDGAINVTGMKETIDVAAGEGTFVRKGEAPQPARKLLPPPPLLDQKPVYKDLPLRLRFGVVEGAVQVRAVLARDSLMRDVIEEKTFGPADAFEVPSIPDGSYYIQSTAIDRDDMEGMPLTPVPLHVKTNPLPPRLETPADRGEYFGTTIEGKWRAVSGASAYHLQVATDSTFKNLVADRAGIAATAATLTFPAFSTYYFRICSVDAEGYEGGWSGPLAAAVSPLPAPPVLDKPRVGGKEILLKWQDLGKETAYRVQMASDPGFRDITVDTRSDAPHLSIPKPRGSGTYFVRVSSINKKGAQGDFSAPNPVELRCRAKFLLLGVAASAMIVLLF